MEARGPLRTDKVFLRRGADLELAAPTPVEVRSERRGPEPGANTGCESPPRPPHPQPYPQEVLGSKHRAFDAPDYYDKSRYGQRGAV